MRYTYIYLLFQCLIIHVFAQIPQGYYHNTTGKIQGELKSALKSIITTGHTPNTYASLWAYFERTDKHTSGDVWDMYSNCSFEFVTDQCGSYSQECDCFNREHSFPSSWFGGEVYPMYADLHHLVPVDGWSNGKRSNYPFGKVGSASWTSLNGSKLGTSNYPGYSGTVFEPSNNYKGDFARIVFYMVTRYENFLSSWYTNDANATAVLDGSEWPAFNPWAKELYLQWHEQDPPDQKEFKRNDSVFVIQHNRNPFIDHPEFARQIWGPDAGLNNIHVISLNIFPQPASEKVFLNYYNIVEYIEIFTVFGSLSAKYQINSKYAELDISELSQGIYFIKVYSGNHTLTGKFTKF